VLFSAADCNSCLGFFFARAFDFSAAAWNCAGDISAF
jgi:hypothetical protein